MKLVISEEGTWHITRATMQLPSKNYETTFQEWKIGVRKGDAVAQNNLCVMYEKGEAVPQDYQTAVRWWRTAAREGHAAAQRNLGEICSFGAGINKDYVHAYMWGKIAAI